MRPKILTSKRTVSLPSRENSMSRRYLRVLEKWVPVGLHYFEDWPDRPNAGHFLGGVHHYGIETIAGAKAFAFAASSPEYDPKTGGCSRMELADIALKAIRYLCFTHDTGPADCVRPQKGLSQKAICGTKWGERGKGFFRESQCGTTVAGIAMVALLLGRRVDDETWRMIVRMHRDYAHRFGTMAPKSGVYTNTQMEENGWTSCGLASVELTLANASKVDIWAETARRWMFSTPTTQQDTKNLGLIDEEQSVRGLTGQIFTTLPDYMAENHGMVHPSYTASAVTFMGQLGVIYGLFGTPLPPHALFNRQKIYDQLKLTTDRVGYMHPVQGMDWPYLWADPGTPTHAAASLLLRDPDAAATEIRALKTLEAIQDGNDGRLYDAEVAAKAHGPQDPVAIRESVIQTPALAYMLHRLYGAGPKPTPESVLERKLGGVRTYPHSGFAFHRHRAGQTSFAWRNNIMALPLNRDGIQTVTPASDSFLAQFEVRNRPDSHELISINVDGRDNGFAAALSMDRAQGSVRQRILFASLPNGTVLSHEALTAQESISVRNVIQGFLRIANENYTALRGNCNGSRTIHTPGGEETFKGYVSTDPKSDIEWKTDNPDWINIDGRIGIVFRGSGETSYLNRHYFNPWRAVADDLILSRTLKWTRARAGAEFAKLEAVVVPNCPVRDTSGHAMEISRKGPDVVGLLHDDHLAVANFGGRTTTATYRFPRTTGAAVPAFAGTVRTGRNSVEVDVLLRAGQARLLQPITLLEVDGTVEITSTESGSVLVRNSGRKRAAVTDLQSGDKASIKPKDTVKLR